MFPSQPINFVFRNVNKETDYYKKATTLDIWMCGEARIVIETPHLPFFLQYFQMERKNLLSIRFNKDAISASDTEERTVRGNQLLLCNQTTQGSVLLVTTSAN